MSSGSSVTLSVVAGGIPNVFTYQWYRNGVAITGETGSTLTISSISTTDVGIYSCTPTNSGGTTNSSSTTISVTSKHNAVNNNDYFYQFFLASLTIGGRASIVSNFAPAVPNGYTISPNNPGIRLTSSGHLITDVLDPQDSGTYTFSSSDLGGATLTISIIVVGKKIMKLFHY